MTDAVAKIAVVAGSDDTTTQTLLAEMAADWRAAGTNVVGVIAEPHGLADRTCGAGILRDVAYGSAYPMFRDAVAKPDACHLDATGATDACAAIISQIAASELVVLNKFGMLESRRRGLAPAFEAAIAAGKPLLTTVSRKQRDAWRTLAPESVTLAADRAALQKWWRTLQPLAVD